MYENPRITEATITVILGDLFPEEGHAVYRSTRPVQVHWSLDGVFARLTVDGQVMVGRVLLTDQVQPVIYLGNPDTPPVLTQADGWAMADMPEVAEEPVLAEVVALAWENQDLVAFKRPRWLGAMKRPMGRTRLQIDDHVCGDQSVTARVLEVPARSPYRMPRVVVAVDDAEALRAAGWEPYTPDPLDVLGWAELEPLSRCLEARSWALSGQVIIHDVLLHDLLSLEVDSLMFLPKDVRDGLEMALLTMPD